MTTKLGEPKAVFVTIHRIQPKGKPDYWMIQKYLAGKAIGEQKLESPEDLEKFLHGLENDVREWISQATKTSHATFELHAGDGVIIRQTDPKWQ